MENTITGPSGRICNFIPSYAVAVTEHDTATFQPGILYVGTTGDVSVMPADGAAFIVFKNVPSGSFLPVYIKAVHTATTAADLVMCY